MAERHEEEVRQLIRLMKLSERATERGYDVERLLKDIAEGELRGPEDYKRKEDKV